MRARSALVGRFASPVQSSPYADPPRNKDCARFQVRFRAQTKHPRVPSGANPRVRHHPRQYTGDTPRSLRLCPRVSDRRCQDALHRMRASVLTGEAIDGRVHQLRYGGRRGWSIWVIVLAGFRFVFDRLGKREIARR